MVGYYTTSEPHHVFVSEVGHKLSCKHILILYRQVGDYQRNCGF